MGDAVHVEVAWETDPLTRPADQDWTRLGSVDADLCVQSLSTSRGVNIRTGEIETGTADATIDDPNGNLDPSNALSEWAPNVLPRRRVRFVVDPGTVPLFWGGEPLFWDGEPLVWDGGGETVLWTGFINRLPIQWRREVQWTDLSASGIFWLLADVSLPPSVLHVVTMDLDPVHYWPLAETSGTLADDVAGTLDGTYRQGARNETMLPYGPGGQLFAAPTTDTDAPRITAPSMTTDTDWTFTAWFQVVTNYPPTGPGVGTGYGILIVAVNYQNGTQVQLAVSTLGSSRGRFTAFFGGGGNFQNKESGQSDVLDGRLHLLAARSDGGVLTVLVDGVDQTVDDGSSGSLPTPATGEVLIGNPDARDPDALVALNWRAGHVAYFDRALSDAEVLEIYEAGTDAWSGDLTGARLNRILDLVGVDEDDRDIATGTQVCGPTFLDGENVMDYIRSIAATEGAPVGEDADGRIFLRERIANDPTIEATFSDDPDTDGGTAVGSLDPEFSLDRVINIARVTRENGVTQESSAPASVTTYGSKTVKLSTLHQSPSGSRATAARLVIRNHDPRLVFPRVVADVIGTPTGVMTGLDIGDAVAVFARPPRGGDPIEQTSIVERVEHLLSGDASWRARFGVAEHTVLPEFWWDEPGQGWDESVWAS